MTDEEKKAIDLLKNIDKQKCVMLECPVVKNNIKRQLKIIELNKLIRKQSKEIEELKEELDRQINARIVNEEFIENNFISKDKIKAKIEEIEKEKDKYEDTPEWELFDYLGGQIDILQSLLEKE